MTKFLFSSVVLIFIATSCQFFQKEVKPIDFTSLDVYPIFEGCDSTADAERIKDCFEKSISEHIQKGLDTAGFTNEAYLKNTGLIIHLDVLKNGECVVSEIEKLSSVEKALPGLQYQIISSVAMLPKIIPGKKLDRSVNSRFMIPLYIEKVDRDSSLVKSDSMHVSKHF